MNLVQRVKCSMDEEGGVSSLSPPPTCPLILVEKYYLKHNVNQEVPVNLSRCSMRYAQVVQTVRAVYSCKISEDFCS